MDAITLLRNDHKTVEQLFRRFEKAGDDALDQKREIVDRIIEELSIHAVIEEQLFYPVARTAVPETGALALESLEEHHIVKWVLSELDGMDPGHERFDAKVTVLIENVRHHVEEEESEFFPKVRSGLNRKTLNEIGDALAEAKTTAPTHPHPRAPDTPPGNTVAGTIASVVDRVGDNISGLAQGGMSAAQDLLARVLGNESQTPKPPSSGSSTSKPAKTATRAARGSTATKSASTATKRAAKAASSTTKSAAKSATSATKSAAKAATSTTKSAATSAAKSASSATKTAAKSASTSKKSATSKAPAASPTRASKRSTAR